MKKKVWIFEKTEILREFLTSRLEGYGGIEVVAVGNLSRLGELIADMEQVNLIVWGNAMMNDEPTAGQTGPIKKLHDLGYTGIMIAASSVRAREQLDAGCTIPVQKRHLTQTIIKLLFPSEPI